MPKLTIADIMAPGQSNSLTCFAARFSSGFICMIVPNELSEEIIDVFNDCNNLVNSRSRVFQLNPWYPLGVANTPEEAVAMVSDVVGKYRKDQMVALSLAGSSLCFKLATLAEFSIETNCKGDTPEGFLAMIGDR